MYYLCVFFICNTQPYSLFLSVDVIRNFTYLHPSMYLSVSVHPFVSVSHIYLSIYISTSFCWYQSVCLLVSQFFRVFIYVNLSLHLFSCAYLSVSLLIYFSVCVSICSRFPLTICMVLVWNDCTGMALLHRKSAVTYVKRYFAREKSVESRKHSWESSHNAYGWYWKWFLLSLKLAKVSRVCRSHLWKQRLMRQWNLQPRLMVFIAHKDLASGV